MRRSLVFALRARNVDVLTAAAANMINREDDDHRPTASALGRTLFTHNTADYEAHQAAHCRRDAVSVGVHFRLGLAI